MIWKPNVGYTNAKLGTIQKENLGVMVRRESKPMEFDFSSAREGIQKYLYYGYNFLFFRIKWVQAAIMAKLTTYGFDLLISFFRQSLLWIFKHNSYGNKGVCRIWMLL